MAKELALMSRVQRTDAKTDESVLRTVAQRLEVAGYSINSKPDFREMALRRTDYSNCVDAIAEHLGKPTTVLIRKS